MYSTYTVHNTYFCYWPAVYWSAVLMPLVIGQ